MAEYINGFSVLKIFGLENWSMVKFNVSCKKMVEAAINTMNWNSFIRPTVAMLCALPVVVIIWWGGHKVLSGAISIGLLVAFIRYAERFLRPVMALSHEVHLIQDAISSSERIRQMLCEKEEGELFGAEGTIDKTVDGDIKYSNVWMEYQKGN